MARRAPPPTVLDRAIAWVSPETGLRRAQARMGLSASGWGGGRSGGYAGARRNRRDAETWSPGQGSADADLLDDLATLRERSRDLKRNAPLAAGALKTVGTSVVGTGLQLLPQMDREVLGLSEDEADAQERAAAREFALWAQECDLRRTLSWPGLQRQAFDSVLENGDAFAYFAWVERPGAPYATRLQLIEADRVSNPDRRTDSAVLAGGVQVDQHGAPVFYYVTDRHPGDRHNAALRWTALPAFNPMGTRQTLHLYEPERIGATRAAPYLAPVILSFKQLDRYLDAELMASVMAAAFAIVTKSNDGPLLDGGLATSTETANGVGRVKVDFEAGLVLDGLKPNESIEAFAASRPNAQFDKFVLAVVQQLGTALQLPFEVLIKHFTASYSAARAALEDAWRFFLVRRAWLASALCQPVYEQVMAEAVARGRLNWPGFFADPARRRAWCGAQWVGQAMPQLDPLKEANAKKVLLETTLVTHEEASMALTGTSWERKLPQRVKEERLKREGGLTAAPAAAAAPTDPEPEPEPDPDRPDEEDQT